MFFNPHARLKAGATVFDQRLTTSHLRSASQGFVPLLLCVVFAAAGTWLLRFGTAPSVRRKRMR